ncbi:MAG TPA: LytTR family DNA-binding domain-containing protein [Bacteroidales bacterium]|nr:LytTR family DNA-binding domain-containing protein [Bacteroidales bacterium]
MKVLIVEDEPYAQKELARLLVQTGVELDIMACTDSVEDSIEWLQLNPMPDLIFMDIQLADGISFEIFRKVRVTAPVIFTTAFDQYAIQAFKVNSIDYLLKPIKLNELTDALHKLKDLSDQYSRVSVSPEPIDIDKLVKSLRPEFKSRFMIRLGDQYKVVDTAEIAYFKAEDNEVVMVTISNRSYIIDHSLDELSQLLDPARFFRISRGYIVGIHSVARVSKYFNSRLLLELQPDAGEKVLISRVKVQEFLKWMDR